MMKKIQIKQAFALYIFFYLMGTFWCEKYIIVALCIVVSVISYKIGYIIVRKQAGIKEAELAEWILFSAIHMIVGYSYIIYICYSQYEKQMFWISVAIATITLFGSLIFYCFKIISISALNDNELNIEKYEEKKKKNQEKVVPYALIGALIGLGLKNVNITADTLCIMTLLFLLLMISCLPYVVYDNYYQYILKMQREDT